MSDLEIMDQQDLESIVGPVGWGEAAKNEQPKEEERQITPHPTNRPYLSRLNYLTYRYLDITRHVQRTRNKIKAIEKQTVKFADPDSFPKANEGTYLEVMLGWKKDLLSQLQIEIRKSKHYKWMKQWPGLGDVSIALLLANVDIEKADTVSKLWSFTGLGLVDGQRQKPTKGKKRNYHSKLKAVLLHYIGQMTLLRMEPWRGIYESSLRKYQNEKPDWTKLHLHLAARRRMVKIWLEQVWVRWREEEGLVVTKPYVFGVLKHPSSHYRRRAKDEEKPKTLEREHPEQISVGARKAAEEEKPDDHERPKSRSHRPVKTRRNSPKEKRTK